MLNELIQLEDKFQPHLVDNDYTFIGPVDQELWNPFFKRVNELAPVVSMLRSIHHSLSHKDSVRKVLVTLPAGTPLRIFVVHRSMSDTNLMHASIEGYCKTNNIHFIP